MIAGLLLRSTLLLALLWIASVAVRRAGASASMRHLVWLAGMGALILLPLLAAVAPPLSLPILPAEAAPPPALALPAAAAPSIASGGATPAAAPGPADLLWTLYLAGVAVLLSRVAFGYHLLGRIWRGATPMHDTRWTEQVEALSAALGIERAVSLRIAGALAMPMTWGILKPRILLPPEALAWPVALRRTVLLHELAHVARRDSLSRLAVALVCALYWFNPAVWIAARRMRLEQEHACDDLVLSLGAKASVYARNLLDVACAFRPPAMAASLCVAMAHRSELEERLTAIVGNAARHRSSRGFAAGAVLLALAVTLLAASLSPVRASRSVQVFASPETAVAPLSPSSIASPVPGARTMEEKSSSPVAAARPAPAVPQARIAAEDEPQGAEPPADYPAMAAQHARDLEAYQLQLERYRIDVEAWHRQVLELRAQHNLANTGNAGNAGNAGNFGNPGNPGGPDQPATPPTPPTPPTAPTPPTPPTPLDASLPTSQGP